MVAEPSDWRWQISDQFTPWYPTMRIFRQRERDRWDPVIQAVANGLREAADARARGTFALTTATRDGASEHLEQDVVQQAGGVDHALKEQHPWRVDETRYGIVQYPSRPAAIADSLRHYGEYAQSQLQTIAR